jgi:GMP synthase-like glutamine amidotransferase
VEVETIMKFVVENEGGQIPSIDDLDDIHAILLTGSKYDAHGDDEWILKLVRWIQGKNMNILLCFGCIFVLMRLVTEVWKTKPDIRFSGVCFGHQVLCRALGSTVEPSPGNEWEYV